MKFIEKSYERSNAWGISLASEHIKSHGWLITRDDENYDIDIEAKRHDKILHLEVEAKSNYPWTCQEDYPFDSVSFLFRKKKYTSDFWYMIICRETEAYALCHSTVIFNYKYFDRVDLKKYERKGKDNFYRVPKDLCSFGQIIRDNSLSS